MLPPCRTARQHRWWSDRRRFIACGIAEISVDRAMRAVLPFIAVLCAGLAVVILVPWFTLVLPRLFKLL
jgi:TRAP-type C4-dicarboxylate transport system permease large subunit